MESDRRPDNEDDEEPVRGIEISSRRRTIERRVVYTEILHAVPVR